MENKMQVKAEAVKPKVRVVTFLSREQLDFLDKVGKDALFLRGMKLSRAQILSQLVDLMMELGVDMKKINLKKETLEQGIMDTIRTINADYSGNKNA